MYSELELERIFCDHPVDRSIMCNFQLRLNYSTFWLKRKLGNWHINKLHVVIVGLSDIVEQNEGWVPQEDEARPATDQTRAMSNSRGTFPWHMHDHTYRSIYGATITYITNWQIRIVFVIV